MKLLIKIKNNRYFKLFSNIYFITFTIFLFWILFFDSNSILVNLKLQKEITNILAQIGNAEVVKSQLLTKHVQVQEEWTANANTLEEKYGKVNVDLATGNIKEIEEEQA